MLEALHSQALALLSAGMCLHLEAHTGSRGTWGPAGAQPGSCEEVGPAERTPAATMPCSLPGTQAPASTVPTNRRAVGAASHQHLLMVPRVGPSVCAASVNSGLQGGSSEHSLQKDKHCGFLWHLASARPSWHRLIGARGAAGKETARDCYTVKWHLLAQQTKQL